MYLIRLTILIPVILISAACSSGPRRAESISGRGEPIVTVTAPRYDETTAVSPRLIHVRDIHGSGIPYEPPFWHVEDLASDPDGTIYIADRGHAHVLKLDAEGRYLGTIGQKGPGPFEFTDAHTMYNMKVCWIDSPGLVAAADPYYKVLLFRKNGEVLSDRITGYYRLIWLMAAVPNGIVIHTNEDPPFTIYDLQSNRTGALGRYLSAEDAGWRSVSRALAGSEISAYPDGGVRVSNNLRPNMLSVAADTLLVHDLNLRNGYRAWNLNTGEVAWQLNLETGDFEPPTFVRYTTGSVGELASWSRRGPPQIYERTYVTSMDYLDGLLFITLSLRGDGTRTGPDRKRAFNPFTMGDDIGFRDWPQRAALEIISLEPDLIAHLPFENKGYFNATIAPGPLLIISFRDPEPHLTVYRIEGLPEME
ncbi:hypothetical protein ACFL6R_00230 [Gemmatimonadota bacterium]